MKKNSKTERVIIYEKIYIKQIAFIYFSRIAWQLSETTKATTTKTKFICL